MRKSLLFIICFIFVFSIFAVGFLDIQFEFSDVKIYVNQIEVLNSEMTINEQNGRKRLEIFNNDEKYLDDEGVINYRIGLRVLPENSTNKALVYTYTPNPRFEFISEGKDEGKIKFFSVGLATIYIEAADGSGVKEIVEIFVKNFIP